MSGHSNPIFLDSALTLGPAFTPGTSVLVPGTRRRHPGRGNDSTSDTSESVTQINITIDGETVVVIVANGLYSVTQQYGGGFIIGI